MWEMKHSDRRLFSNRGIVSVGAKIAEQEANFDRHDSPVD
jgi:hypothetical protein